MFKDFISKHIKSQASYVEFGYGQVEPNHLSAQRTAQVYAQLPADAEIDVLEQGQFVKYDYANGVCNFKGKGEWMLVFNEIKLYREGQWDCEFAMVKDNYQAHVYSPYDAATERDAQSRYYNGKDADGNTDTSVIAPDLPDTYAYDKVTAAADYYEPNYNEDPFHILTAYKPAMMPEGTTMVPRVFKTNVGDIFTTNTINADSLAVGATLKVGDDGILTAGEDDAMTWQVVKVYTMPDGQAGVKIMRIK